MNTTTAPTGSLVRILMAVVLALTLGLTLVDAAGATKPKATGTVSERTQGQRDLCDVSGGSFSIETTYSTVFRGQVTKTVTTCKGGKNPQTCTNTSKDTTCTQGFTVPQQDSFDNGSVADGQIDEIQTAPEPEVIVDDGSIGEGQIEPFSPGESDSGSAKPQRIEIKVEFAPIAPLP